VCWQIIKDRKPHCATVSPKEADEIISEDEELGKSQSSDVVTLCYLPHSDYVHAVHSLNNRLLTLKMYQTYESCGARGSVVVKALCYKPEGRGFKSR
jgi:hypothetical protein